MGVRKENGKASESHQCLTVKKMIEKQAYKYKY